LVFFPKEKNFKKRGKLESLQFVQGDKEKLYKSLSWSFFLWKKTLKKEENWSLSNLSKDTKKNIIKGIKKNFIFLLYLLNGAPNKEAWSSLCKEQKSKISRSSISALKQADSTISEEIGKQLYNFIMEVPMESNVDVTESAHQLLTGAESKCDRILTANKWPTIGGFEKLKAIYLALNSK